MFKLNTQTLLNTGERLAEQGRTYRQIRDEMDDCLSKLRSMSDLSHETKKLQRILDKTDEEIHLMSVLADSIVEIKCVYERSDDLSGESADECPRNYRQAAISEISIPVYEGGVIKMINL